MAGLTHRLANTGTLLTDTYFTEFTSGAEPNSGSLNFNGTTGYLSNASGTIGNFGTGDFTFEHWAYCSVIGGNGNNTIDFRGTGGTGTALRISFGSASLPNRLIAGWTGDSQLDGGAGNLLTANRWYHIAVTRSGTTCRLFLDGVIVATVTDSSSIVDNGCIVGSFRGLAGFFNGYISNLRVVKGTALYTSNFTPPTTLNNVTNTSLLLKTLTTSPFADSSNNNYTMTVNGGVASSTLIPNSASQQTQQVKFTAINIIGQLNEISGRVGSLQFNGSTDFLSVPNTNIGALNAREFTIEAFIYLTSYSAGFTGQFYSTLFSTLLNNGSGFELDIAGTATTYTGVRVWASSGSVNTLLNYSFLLNTWYHIALTRTSAGNYVVYINGTSIGSFNNANGWTDSSPYNIGRNAFTGYTFNFPGYISNFRLNIGTPLYSGNFTPPRTALTSVANTKLLLNTTLTNPFVDSSGNNNTITVGGGTKSNGLKPNTFVDIATTDPKLRISNTGIITITGTGQFDEYTLGPVPSLNTANFRISSVDSLSATSNGTSITSIPNLGTGSYTITSSTNSPKKVLYNGYPVLAFNSTDAFCLDISSELDLSTSGTLFFVGRNIGNRLVALGGILGSSSGSCFFGFSSPTNTACLFRNTSDGGVTVTGLTDNGGLEVIAVVKNGTSVNLYVNSLSFTNYNTATGTFKFGKIGARDYSSILNGQKSDGYIGDVLYYNSILTNDQIGSIITELKAKYGIA